MRKFYYILLFIPILSSAQTSQNMNLLGTYDFPTTQGNDIWGWADSAGNEFALVGLRNGVSCVNVTNPSAPIEMFFIPDTYSIWRDIKTWGNYAYITTDVTANVGLLIVDLTDMSGNTYWHVTNFTNPNNSSSVEFTIAHDLYIDENGICYIFGAGSNTGSNPSDGAIFLDVEANPTNPVYLGEWDDEYIHDAMVRGDTMYAGCIYTGKVFFFFLSDKLNPITIGSHATPNAFTHNAWVSDNGDYVFTTDEKSDAYLGAFDISNLSNIQEVDRIQSNPGSNSIPHNTFVDGNFLITSYYRDGTTVHDITHPNYMIQVAYYDSYSGSGNGFDGCWGTYPYLPSGNIISSDINSGAGGKGRLLIYGRDFQQACYLQGSIYDGLTGSSLANANMKILTTNTIETSNLLGFYQSAILDSGTYQLLFSSNNYTSDTITVFLNNGVITMQDAFLYPPCNTLNIETNQNISVCDSSFLIVGNSTYIASGSYIDSLKTTYGCDSIIYTNLTINSSIYISNYDTICDGQSIIVGVNQYDQSGLYTDILTTSTGCDSVISTSLLVKTNVNFTQNISICSNDEIQVGSNYYNQNGTYVDILPSHNGCDSIITTIVSIIPITTVLNHQTICLGDSIVVGNNVYFNVGLYTDILQTSNGCDSIINTTITILPNIINSLAIEICYGDSLVVGNNTYFQTGTYTDTLTNGYGCDSITISDLSVSNPVGIISANATQIMVIANGGIPPYNYTVYGPSSFFLQIINTNSLQLISSSTIGQYYFIATDALGCQSQSVDYIFDFYLSINDISLVKKLVKVTDMLGKKVIEQKNMPLFYHFNDGSVEKIIIIE